MNPHITTIQFDASTFNADDSLISLLMAKSHYNELSPKDIHSQLTFEKDSQKYFGDSSGKNLQPQSHLASKLLQLFSLAQTVVQPVAFYCTIENPDVISLPTSMLDSFPLHPFLATVGRHFDIWRNQLSMMTEKYSGHIIGMWFLHRCVKRLANTLKRGDSYCLLYPGSFNTLPMTYNRMLHSLFENEAQTVGITINDECMFSPLHTVAGFIVPLANQNNCAICRLQQCQFRNILT